MLPLSRRNRANRGSRAQSRCLAASAALAGAPWRFSAASRWPATSVAVIRVIVPLQDKCIARRTADLSRQNSVVRSPALKLHFIVADVAEHHLAVS